MEGHADEAAGSRRVAVVTGGAGAIGGAIAAELTASGHTVVSLDKAGGPLRSARCGYTSHRQSRSSLGLSVGRAWWFDGAGV